MLALTAVAAARRTKHLSSMGMASTVGSVKIVVDHDRCQGHGRCYDLAPETFAADDEGHVTLLAPGQQLPADAEPQAHLAVRNCPERALSLER
jgi:ferredoxin